MAKTKTIMLTYIKITIIHTPTEISITITILQPQREFKIITT